MKVLQTLGRHASVSEGIFAYRRARGGVEITAMGTNQQAGQTISISHADWGAILHAVGGANLYRLSTTASNDPPVEVLHDTIMGAFAPVGWTWNTSWAAYVAAILEHEGSVDLYGGGGGPGVGHPIVLQRDV
jgi:hypothetical protein